MAWGNDIANAIMANDGSGYANSASNALRTAVLSQEMSNTSAGNAVKAFTNVLGEQDANGNWNGFMGVAQRSAAKELNQNNQLIDNYVMQSQQDQIQKELERYQVSDLGTFKDNLVGQVQAKLIDNHSKLSAQEALYYLQHPGVLEANKNRLTPTDFKALNELSSNYTFREQYDTYLRLNNKAENLKRGWLDEEGLMQKAQLRYNNSPLLRRNNTVLDIFRELDAEQRTARQQGDLSNSRFLYENYIEDVALNRILSSKTVNPFVQQPTQPQPSGGGTGAKGGGTGVVNTQQPQQQDTTETETPTGEYLYGEHYDLLKEKGIADEPLFDGNGGLTEAGIQEDRALTLKGMDLSKQGEEARQIIQGRRDWTNPYSVGYDATTGAKYGVALGTAVAGGAAIWGTRGAAMLAGELLLTNADAKLVKDVFNLKEVQDLHGNTKIKKQLTEVQKDYEMSQDKNLSTKERREAINRANKNYESLMNDKEFQRLTKEAEKKMEETKAGKEIKTKLTKVKDGVGGVKNTAFKYGKKGLFWTLLIGAGVGAAESAISKLDGDSFVSKAGKELWNAVAQNNEFSKFVSDMDRFKDLSNPERLHLTMPEIGQQILNWDLDQIEKDYNRISTMSPYSPDEVQTLFNYARNLQDYVYRAQRYNSEKKLNQTNSKERAQIKPFESVGKDIDKYKKELGSIQTQMNKTPGSPSDSATLKAKLETTKLGFNQSVNVVTIGSMNSIGTNRTDENPLASNSLSGHILATITGNDPAKFEFKTKSNPSITLDNKNYQPSQQEQRIIAAIGNNPAKAIIAQSMLPDLDYSNNSIEYVEAVLNDEEVTNILNEVYIKGNFYYKDGKKVDAEVELSERLAELAEEKLPNTKLNKIHNNTKFVTLLNNRSPQSTGMINKVIKGTRTHKPRNFDEAVAFCRKKY